MDPNEHANPMGPGGPSEENDSSFTMLIAGLGGFVLLLVGAIGLTLATGTGVEPGPTEAPKVANAWPSQKDLGTGGKKPVSRRNRKPKKDIKLVGSPFKEMTSSVPGGFGGLIMAPSFGKLKSRQDWQDEADRLSAEGTSKAVWQLGYLYSNRRNPFQDDNTALGYFQQAWSMGAGMGAYELAQAHEKGLFGLQKDPYTAKGYYQKAESYGVLNATKDLERLAKDGI